MFPRMRPAFLACAGVGGAGHAKKTLDFYNAYLDANIPADLQLHAQGVHGESVSLRKGIPFGTWQYRFLDWFADMG